MYSNPWGIVHGTFLGMVARQEGHTSGHGTAGALCMGHSWEWWGGKRGHTAGHGTYRHCINSYKYIGPKRNQPKAYLEIIHPTGLSTSSHVLHSPAHLHLRGIVDYS